MKPRFFENCSFGFTPFNPAMAPHFGVNDTKLQIRLRDRAKKIRDENPGILFISCAASGCQNEQREWWYFCSEDCRNRYVAEEGQK